MSLVESSNGNGGGASLPTGGVVGLISNLHSSSSFSCFFLYFSNDVTNITERLVGMTGSKNKRPKVVPKKSPFETQHFDMALGQKRGAQRIIGKGEHVSQNCGSPGALFLINMLTSDTLVKSGTGIGLQFF